MKKAESEGVLIKCILQYCHYSIFPNGIVKFKFHKTLIFVILS